MRRITILGSTGSIGRQTLELVEASPERFEVVGLAAGRNTRLLAEQVERFRPRYVAALESSSGDELFAQCRAVGAELAVGVGAARELATTGAPDLVVSGIVGEAGLLPTLAAVEAGIDVALANKESLVVAGEIVTRTAREKNVMLLPLDSEHFSLWRCLHGRPQGSVGYLLITASGGPFRDLPLDEFEAISPERAVAHPVWPMGQKISVDSATLMNKGLEVIETHWLFGVRYSDIRVAIHPQAMLHGLVGLRDGSLLAHFSPPDMKLPIAAMLEWPEESGNYRNKLDVRQLAQLEFRDVDHERFPCLPLAYQAGKIGGSAPAVLNAANEVAVARFLRGEIAFTEIYREVASALDRHELLTQPSLDDLLRVSQETRREMTSLSTSARG